MAEKYQASENMQKFFKNLLEIKNFVKVEASKQKNPTLDEIYKRLDQVIKSTEESKK